MRKTLVQFLGNCSPGEGIDYPLQYSWVSLVAQMVKNPPAVWKTWVQSLGWEDPLDKGMATHSTILTWRIPMDRGAWWASVHGVATSRTWLSIAQHWSLKLLPIPQSKLFYSQNVRNGRIDTLWRNINKIGQWGRAEENLDSDYRSFPSFNVHLLTCHPAYACNWLSPGKECNPKKCHARSSVCAVWLCFCGPAIQVRP